MCVCLCRCIYIFIHIFAQCLPRNKLEIQLTHSPLQQSSAGLRRAGRGGECFTLKITSGRLAGETFLCLASPASKAAAHMMLSPQVLAAEGCCSLAQVAAALPFPAIPLSLVVPNPSVVDVKGTGGAAAGFLGGMEPRECVPVPCAAPQAPASGVLK